MSYRRYEYDVDAVRDLRKKVSKAFRSLRRQNITAKANFMCCSGCATSAMELKGKKGGVYWHRQADASLKEYGTLYIGFCTDDGEGAKEVGAALRDALVAAGVDVSWNGSGDKKVLAFADPLARQKHEADRD